MREPVRDRGRLCHMIDAIDCILRNTQSMGFEDLHRNELEFYGIVKSIPRDDVELGRSYTR